ncbi:glycosyl hydrolase [Telluribacter humicola]|uniref:glycosyl hydrolase n=1 Tax=Telluribacter humicola TaxID=1720261 RepID=UPI001A97052E|nr:glycosyl hydrolase [Telluribacter humicola]
MRFLYLFLLFFCCLRLDAQPVSTTKPWTQWWWMGSAVTKEDITTQLQQLSKAGMGGVTIIPIYGVKGHEQQFIPYLSDKWLDVMQHAVREGQRLGMGVDMATGTGWPFGGPNVSKELGAQKWKVVEGQLVAEPTRQQVKRSAPGGAGLVLDPFSASAMDKYLTWFDSAFTKTKTRPRAMYNDSYEVYGANWAHDFLSEFRKRRGYDLQQQLPLFLDSTSSVASTLVKIDYHQTLSELLRERYARPWIQWSHKHGFVTRYQAHGSPGNLLDLYEEADIPETEAFGTSKFPIPGVRIDPDYEVDRFGAPHPLAMKFASSAAHFSGKKLVSSETATWLANHFKVSLSQVKPQIDELFTGGINHIFYHGTTYSPARADYPGWLFYASTNFGPTSHFFEHLHLLNGYIERCQSLLQNSQPDNDVLVYFPIHDLWAKPAKSSGGIHQLEVHHVDRWLLQLPFGQLTEQLWRQGYAFDFVSDAQLSRLKADKNGVISTGSTTYKTLLIPASTYLPEETLDQLIRLSKAGVKIVFAGNVPTTVAGFGEHAAHQQRFEEKLKILQSGSGVSAGATWQQVLNKYAAQETWAEQGLTFIRKKQNDNTLYFIANLNDQYRGGWIKLAHLKGTVEKYDPLTNQTTVLPARTTAGQPEVYLKLLPGQSCFVRAATTKKTAPAPTTNQQVHALPGQWKLDFVKGKPSLPAPTTLSAPQSWTSTSDSAGYFTGTARYTLRFDLPASVANSKSVTLDLGDVREVAEVRLNGKPIGTAWSVPFVLDIAGGTLKPKDNLLEVEVSNLSANYMRLVDKQSPGWKKFYDINIVDIQYKPFDASKWELMPSGLLGPVRLVY